MAVATAFWIDALEGKVNARARLVFRGREVDPEAVATAIAGVREDVLYAGGPDAPTEDTKDPIWLPLAGQQDWIVLMRDKRIRTRPGERRALVDAGVRAFCLTHAGNYTRWEVLELLVNLGNASKVLPR